MYSVLYLELSKFLIMYWARSMLPWNRLGKILVGYTVDKKPLYAKDLKVDGAMALLLKDI